MTTRHILYYCNSSHSYNEETPTHYYGSFIVEQAANKWEHLLASLKQKQICAAIWVEQIVDMEKGVYRTRVVKHEIRKLPKVLEINKVKSNGKIRGEGSAQFTVNFPMPSVIQPTATAVDQTFFNWGQPTIPSTENLMANSSAIQEEEF